MTIYNREAIPYWNLGGKSWSHRQIAEKEHLVTMDRFTWHGGTQKCDIMTKVTKKNTNTVSVILVCWNIFPPETSLLSPYLVVRKVVLWHWWSARNGLCVVCAIRLQLSRTCSLQIRSCCWKRLSEQYGRLLKVLQFLIGIANTLATSTKTCLKWPAALSPPARSVNVWLARLGNPYPHTQRLLTPVFVPCSTNAGRDLVKVSDMQWRTWMCGGVAHSFCTAVKRLPESKKRHQDCLMSSAQSFYGPCLRFVAHSLAVFLGTCHSSKCPVCHCTWLSFTSR